MLALISPQYLELLTTSRRFWNFQLSFLTCLVMQRPTFLIQSHPKSPLDQANASTWTPQLAAELNPELGLPVCSKLVVLLKDRGCAHRQSFLRTLAFRYDGLNIKKIADHDLQQLYTRHRHNS
jgi:hypothetical protein